MYFVSEENSTIKCFLLYFLFIGRFRERISQFIASNDELIDEKFMRLSEEFFISNISYQIILVR